MITKPTSEDDLDLPFSRIGAANWDDALRKMLEAYGVPIPAPVPASDIDRLHLQLGAPLPAEWAALLRTFGPLKLEVVGFVTPDQIRPAIDLWFRDFLKPEEREQLPSLLYLADTGSDNFFVFDTANDVIRLASHDPAGLFEWIPSITDLLRYACAQLPTGYYGWPDDDLAEMVERYTDNLLSKWWHARPDAQSNDA